MEPVWEDVATNLRQGSDNYVNVAKVDCDAHRGIGSRFDIKAFPSIKMISKGKIYTYKGKKDVDEIVAFAKGNFRFEESENVPKDLGIIGDIMKIVDHAYKSALFDIETGNFYTKDVFFMVMPILFVLSMFLLLALPLPPGTSSAGSSRVEKLRKKR